MADLNDLKEKAEALKDQLGEKAEALKEKAEEMLPDGLK